MTLPGRPRMAGGYGPALTDQMPWVEVGIPTTLGASTLSPSQATFMRLRVAKPITITQMTMAIVTSSGNFEMGVYQSDGTTLTRLATTGSVASAPVSQVQTAPLGTAVTLQPGVDYYFAFVPDNGTISFGRVSATAPMFALGDRGRTRTASMPLPATATLASMNGNASALFWIFAN